MTSRGFQISNCIIPIESHKQNYVHTLSNIGILDTCDGDVDSDVTRMISSLHQINSDGAITFIHTDVPCIETYGNRCTGQTTE